MSKKKAFSGNTMSLKDFHGGSIPTELPLPSAPGVSNDWSGQDRPNSWGGRTTRPDHWVRPRSSPAIRQWDDRTPFLSRNVCIGRNFDEDERKPLDGFSAPRRIFSDESFQDAQRKVEWMPEAALSRQVSGPFMAASIAGSYTGRVHEGAHVDVHSHNGGGDGGWSVGRSYPNAWTGRKELVTGIQEPVLSAWSEASAMSKLAHASALEKVSSGRWQTNLSIHNWKNDEVIEHLETEKDVGSRGYDGYTCNRMNVASGRENSDAMLARHTERVLAIEDRILGHRKELVHRDRDRDRAPLHSGLKERTPAIHVDWVQSRHSDAKFGGSIAQPLVQPEASERPKVKFLPRTKPVESPELPIPRHKQENQLPRNPAHDHAITIKELHPNVNDAKPCSLGFETENQMVERRKLNLKPRSQPLEQLDGNVERERNLLFGGARPREMVLKEGGIDDAAMSNHDLGRHFDRTKHDIVKTERVTEHATPSRNGQRTDSLPLDQRIVKKYERKDQQVGTERVDVQRRNWRNENWRSNRDNGRQQQQLKERQPSPETWRKPVEQPKPASPGTGLRYGKVASALELAQAFSRSFSDRKLADRCSGQKGLPGKKRMPFSRLMTPTPRPQINGY